ncbi:FtsX-like permease family protein [Pseudoalteromonas sp. JBTF-M23]|uniref:FtsX-like permease family protein n=1 Tax=Pseudoalteromonas caenipelagi TaxID=2726988 RepID=A0A849VDY8_9GAMM|nr:FtsX-like permease family protein [Pseudoalteromonas caenipelagi]NOU49911.1 FtsX-like permease family protein [Pseudoalteromonas caenipelagi]
MSELKPIFNALCRSKVGAILLLLQIAITTAIVSNSAFIISEKIAYLEQDTGYPEQDIFTFEVMSFGENIDYMRQAELDETAIRQMPGVIDAVTVNSVPLSGGGSSSSFRLVPAGQKGKGVQASIFEADSHFINTFGIKILEGRNFTEAEVSVVEEYSQYPSVGLITKAMADELFPDGDALGKTLYHGDLPMQIIGITDVMKGPWLQSERRDRSAILPFVFAQKLTLFSVRTEPEQRAQVMQQIEQYMLNLENKRVIEGLKGLDDVKADYVAPDRLTMRMLLVMIVVLTLITALGIFGLTLFNISKRTKQIGTRRALGARKSDIIRYFVIENAMISMLGLIVGSGAAVMMAQQLMKHYSLSQMPLFYVLFTAVGVLLISLLAVVGPAKRAANISPSIATRTI